jgi:hypothetical protein
MQIGPGLFSSVDSAAELRLRHYMGSHSATPEVLFVDVGTPRFSLETPVFVHIPDFLIHDYSLFSKMIRQ